MRIFSKKQLSRQFSQPRRICSVPIGLVGRGVDHTSYKLKTLLQIIDISKNQRILPAHSISPPRSINNPHIYTCYFHREIFQQINSTPAIKAIAGIRNSIFTNFGTSRSAPSLLACDPKRSVKNSTTISDK